MAGDILGGQLALELVGYDKEVAAAMKFALGKTMVCQDVDAAKTCAFSDGIRAKSVTLSGGFVSPSSISGDGGGGGGGDILSSLALYVVVGGGGGGGGSDDICGGSILRRRL